jgi:hypothetical protein
MLFVYIKYQATDTSVAYKKNDYILVEGIGTSIIYDTDTKSPLSTEIINGSLYYKLPSSGLFYVRCNVSSMLGTDKKEADSFQLKFTCKLYTSYGLKQQSDTSEKTVYLIKRGLFDIH